MRARRLRPPMASIPASEIMIAKEQGLNPSTIPASTTAGTVIETLATCRLAGASGKCSDSSTSSTASPTTEGRDSRTLPTRGSVKSGRPGSFETTVTVLRKGPGRTPVVTDTFSSAVADGWSSSDETDAFAPQQALTLTILTGTGHALLTTTVRSAVSTGPSSPKPHSAGSNTSPGAPDAAAAPKAAAANTTNPALISVPPEVFRRRRLPPLSGRRPGKS